MRNKEVSSSVFGHVKPQTTLVRNLAYDKLSGARLQKSIPYTGEATSRSGKTSVILENGKIIAMSNIHGDHVYRFKQFHENHYSSSPIKCIFVNGIYLSPDELETIFPEFAMLLVLRDIKISKMWPSFNLKYREVTADPFVESSHATEDRYVIGVLEL